MLMIRLQRVGRKNDPSFRAVVVDSHAAAKTGKVIEVVGNYDARHGEPTLKADRILDWINKGAQVSDTMNNLLIKKGVVKGAKKNVASSKLGKKAQAAKDTKEKAQVEATKAEAKKAEQAEAPAEPVAEEINAEVTETPAEAETTEVPAEETKAEEAPTEASVQTEETPTEETKTEETPAEEKPAE